MQLAGREWVQFPIRSLDFSVEVIFPALIMALCWTEPLKEMSTRNLPEDKRLPARKADNLTAI
jgi:hypothetical protein